MTKTEIIAAAFKAWGREFYLNTSLTQLAHELGVSKPALYRHFTHKQALLDAMAVYFYNDITAFIQAETPLDSVDREQKAFHLIRAVATYYGRNVNMFIFALVRIYDRQGGTGPEAEMQSRGVSIDMESSDNSAWPQVMRMVFSTITFFMADFHKSGKSFSNPPSEAAIAAKTGMIGEIIRHGLGYSIKEINAIDYEKLEQCITGSTDTITDDPLLKAVAQAVAEAGPWEASMEQVARYSGLSKSSLYGHFKNKEDMLRRFFINEFMRIIEFTRQGMDHAEQPLERLYLGVCSIAVYLDEKPEILNTLDRIRTRQLDTSSYKKRCYKKKGELPSEFVRLFEGITVQSPHGGAILDSETGRRCLPHWILFLIVGMLMRQDVSQQAVSQKTRKEDIRTMYRYLTSGIKGINEYEKNN